MQFLSPKLLWLLPVFPFFFAFYVLAQRRRRRYRLRYSSLLTIKQALDGNRGLRRHVPPFLFLAGIMLLIVAMARPVAGLAWSTAQGTVILAIDVSASMQANDLKPNRLTAAQAAARALVQREPGDVRIGVVSFSDVAAIGQAPTTNRDAVLAAINRLTLQRGTGIGGGFFAALAAISDQSQATEEPTHSPGVSRPTRMPVPMTWGQRAPAIIVLLTDGENNVPPSPLDLVNHLIDEGVPVYVVGP